MVKGEDPDEMYEPSQLDLHCLQRYLFRFTGLKDLTYDCLSHLRM